MWSFIWFLHKNIDKRLLLCRRSNGWDIRDGWRWWGWRLDEDDLVVFLWGWRRGLRTLGGVVCGLWRRDVHIHVFVDDGRLLWRSVLWGRTAGVATSSASSNRSGVTV